MFLKALYSYEKHFLYSQKFVNFAIGVLPDINVKKRFAFFTVIFIFTLPIFFQMCYQLFMTNLKLQLMIKLLQRIFSSICFVFLYWYLFLNVELRTMVFVHVKKDYELVTDNEELNIIEKYAKQSKNYTVFMIVLSHFYIMLLTFPSILQIILYYLGIFDDIRLTLPLYFSSVFDIGLRYYCLLIYQLLVMYLGLTILIISFSIYLVILQHAFSQFKIIAMKIRRPFIKDHFNNWKHFNELDWIIDIIKRYKRVTKLINLINALTEIILLIIIFCLTLILMINFIYIFQLSVDLQDISENIEMFVFIVGTMFSVYIYFYIGQELLNQSNYVFEELCQVPFYMLSIKTQKLFLFLITRSMQPSFLSIGGLFVSSLEVLSALMQKTFSFATVFHSFKS